MIGEKYMCLRACSIIRRSACIWCAFLLVLLMTVSGASAEMIYSSDYSRDLDGWFAAPMETVKLERLSENALHVEGRNIDWEGPSRNFELIPNRAYTVSVDIRHNAAQDVYFMITAAQCSDGEWTYLNLAFGNVNQGEWQTISGVYVPEAFDSYVMYVETVGAPDLAFDIRDFRMTLLDDVSDYRPEAHYAPPYGWINDPNGLILDDGQWHLFAQHYPDDIVWGPMHWRHAVSTDLVHWEDQGIALYPDDEHGMAFSGSAVIDAEGTAGFGSSAMVLLYTGHGEYERQMLAGSMDRNRFELYDGNPVIDNADKPDFRDPKVFRNELLDCWTMAVAAGDCVEFYASEDLIHWSRTGEFRAAADVFGAVYECPDVFPVKAPDGSDVWVMIASLTLPFEMGGSRTVYFLGDFDGSVFLETMPSDELRFLDSGYDDYAAVSFANTDRPVIMGWSHSWYYAGEEPTDGFRGSMTYARELSLADTDDGLRLAARPITPEFDMKDIAPIWTDDGRQVYEAALPGELFRLCVHGMPGFTLELSNDAGEVLAISVREDGILCVDRSNAGRRDFSELYAQDRFSVMEASRLMEGEITLDLYFDHMLSEVFVDSGTLVNTSVVFPVFPYQRVTLTGGEALEIGTVRM